MSGLDREFSARGKAIRSRQRIFPWFLLATLLPILAMPFTNLDGNLAEKLCLPLVAMNLIVQSLRIMPAATPGLSLMMSPRNYRLLAIATGIAVWLPYLFGRHTSVLVLLIVQLIVCTFFGLTALRIVQLLAQVEGVNGRTLCLGSAGYVQLGLTAGQVATTLEVIHPHSFKLGMMLPGSEVVERLTYYAFTTLASIGYGDVLPSSPAAELFAVSLSITGTLYITLVIGLLLSRYIRDQTPQVRDDQRL